jgi:predicted RNA binding protein YcfA (HicA-like mRNA interferase family)
VNRLPSIRPDTVLRVLQSIGFERKRQRGSHIFLAHPDGRTTVVPYHRGEDLDRGLLRKIIQDAKLTPTEFIALLRD